MPLFVSYFKNTRLSHASLPLGIIPGIFLLPNTTAEGGIDSLNNSNHLVCS